MLRLVGCGNEHAVFAYCGHESSALSGLALRVRHKRQATAVAVPPRLPALALSVGEAEQLTAVRLPKDVAAQLCASALMGADPNRPIAANAVAAMEAAQVRTGADSSDNDSQTTAWLEVEHTRVQAGCNRGLCIEIKPKAGVLPPGPPLSSLAPGKCRFCLYAALKARRQSCVAEDGTTAAPSPPRDEDAPSTREFCPLDFFSHVQARVARALFALLLEPRNNLRVFDASTGRLVFGATAGADFANGLLPLIQQTFGDADAPAVSPALSAEASRAQASRQLVQALAEVLCRERELLVRLCAAQARAAVGTEHAMKLYDYAATLARGGEAGLCELLRIHQAGCRCTSRCRCCDGRPCVEACSRPLHAHSLQDCVCTLSEWLLGLSASDASLMITLSWPDDRISSADGEGSGCSASAAVSILRRSVAGETSVAYMRKAPELGNAIDGSSSPYRYRIAVVDTGPKPAAKIRAHHQLEQQIVEHWRLATKRPQHNCELAALAHSWPCALAAWNRHRDSHRQTRPESDGSDAQCTISLDSGGIAPLGKPDHAVQCILVVAFGTRGDVMPLLRVASSLLSGGQDVHFATHECFRETVLRLVVADARPQDGSTSSKPSGSLSFTGVATDPLRPLTASVFAEYGPILHALSRRRISFVLFNLFSLGACHIAEALRVGCVVVSPCTIPYSHPASFATTFAATHPELYAILTQAPTGCLGWDELSHWMWPLWSVERWGEWRQRALGLGKTPLLDSSGRLTVGSPAELPRATPLLYAVTSALLPRPAYWPPSVSVVGYLSPVNLSAAQLCDETRGVERMLASSHPLYVGFGSSSALLLQPDAPDLAEAVAAAALCAAHALKCPLLLHCCGDDDLYACWRRMLRTEAMRRDPDGQIDGERTEVSDEYEVMITYGSSKGTRASTAGTEVVLVRRELHLDSCFSRCLAVVHHGGAGTTASALRTGAAQLILPFIFDQFETAERLEHSGVGLRLHRNDFTGGGAAAGRSRPSSEEFSDCAISLSPVGLTHVASPAVLHAAETLLLAVKTMLRQSASAQRDALRAQLDCDDALAEVLSAIRGQLQARHIRYADSKAAATGSAEPPAHSTGVSALVAAAHRWKRARTDTEAARGEAGRRVVIFGGVATEDEKEPTQDISALVRVWQSIGLAVDIVDWKEVAAFLECENTCRDLPSDAKATLGGSPLAAYHAQVVAYLPLMVWSYHETPSAFARFNWMLQQLSARRAAPSGDLRALRRISLHKGYLLDLERAGVPIVPTTILPSGSGEEALRAFYQSVGRVFAGGQGCAGSARMLDSESVSAQQPIDERVLIVAKPAIGGGGDDVERLHDGETAAEQWLLRTVASRDMLLQPFLPLVSQHGELAFVFVNGELLHALRKEPVGWHATTQPVTKLQPPPPAAEATARHALETACALSGLGSPAALYLARVDLLPHLTDGSMTEPIWLVSEVEVGWPHLFLDADTTGRAATIAGHGLTAHIR